MPSTENDRPGSPTLDTALGPVRLDLSVPGRVGASAGGAGGVAPLRVEGRDVAVSLTLVHAAGSGGFSLLAEDAPLAWDHADPGARLPPGAWKAAATCVLEAAEAFLSRNPGIGRVADLAALRARLAEVDESLDMARGWVEHLRAERDDLIRRQAPLRRNLVAGVP